ncbi:Rho GTPase activation protein [Thozetella sp. PMI_491]|nr:Rho GTPase activation protein [Thozetella sp. PMI_491]
MDWISITTNCFAASNAVAKTSLLLHGFLRELRELRSEIDQILGELHSLDTTLDLLKEDAAAFPTEVAARTPAILENCTAVINELGGFITVLSSHTMSIRDKKARWSAGRKQMAILRLTLQVHKSILGLAVDLVGLTITRKASAYDAGYRADEVPRTLALPTELIWLAAGVQEQSRSIAALKAYLDALQAHAEYSGIRLGKAEPPHLSPTHSFGSSGEPPDSAIEIPDSPTIPSPPMSFSHYVTPPIDECDESVADTDLDDGLPPAPPPKAPARISAAQRPVTSIGSQRRPSTGFGEHDKFERSVVLRTTSHVEVPRRTTSLRLPEAPRLGARDDDDARSVTPSRTGLGRFFGHVRNKMSTSTLNEPAPRERRPSTSAGTASSSEQSSIRRSASRRLSTMKIIALPKARKLVEPLGPPEPDSVFGVTLSKSMQVASAAARTRHGGDGGGTSSRQFPRCVLKCASYVREKGLDTVELFSRPEDDELAAALQVEFSSGPSYGEDLDLDMFGPGPAAELLVRFLSQLRRPLVPDAVARRWVKLSRRATVAGMAAPRFEEHIDFWEEAFEGLRGPSRNVVKLLLNLWGDVADHADANEMTAERLAGSLVKPLMHPPSGSYDTDLMLGLAFIIRKRSEYTLVLQGDKRPSNAAFQT